jgi:hypothetical protein
MVELYFLSPIWLLERHRIVIGHSLDSEELEYVPISKIQLFLKNNFIINHSHMEHRLKNWNLQI